MESSTRNGSPTRSLWAHHLQHPNQMTIVTSSGSSAFLGFGESIEAFEGP
jgi:hypothetical protein